MSESPPNANGMRWDLAVFGAPVAGVVGMFASLILLLPLAVLNRYVFHIWGDSPPDAFWLLWLTVWGLVPCVVLGYLSGRSWSFVGAAPMLVLWPVGVALEGGPGQDYLLTLPITGAVAAALALGWALRSARKPGKFTRHHRPVTIS